MLGCVILGLLLFIGAFLLLVHHGWWHYHEPDGSPAKQESFLLVGYFQPSDVANHETWIVVCLTNALSLAILAPLMT